MNRELSYHIMECDSRKTIRDFLKEQGFSRQILIHLKQNPECVRLNGIPVFLNSVLKTGDRLNVVLVEQETSAIPPASADELKIIYEDEDILAINKPSGLPIHPSIHHYTDTLANQVMGYYQSQGLPFVFRCINRLDRDTTGLTLIAKNLLSSCVLSEQVRTKQLQRTYLALAYGQLPNEGVISAPIARSSDSIITRIVDFERGQSAVTTFKTLAYYEPLSFLSLQLLTGRTHQIRVHLKHFGTPLIGDSLYAPEYMLMERQALHSSQLSFIHPVTKKEMQLTAPLPLDMQRLFPWFSDVL